MRVVLANQALKDMKWWRRYYRENFPAGHASAAAHLAKAVELIMENGFLGSVVEGHDLRKFTIYRTPFSLIYRIGNDELLIARIWDGRQDPQKFYAKQ